MCAANRQSQEKTFVCVCGSFRRQGDLTRHTRSSVEAKHYQPRLMPRASLSRLFKPWAVSRFKVQGDQDCKRHKCVAERRKPVSEQRGSVQCQMCRRWFRSKAVHETECGR